MMGNRNHLECNKA